MYIHLFLFCKIDFKKWGCWIKTYMHFEASYLQRTITDFIMVVMYSFDYWIDFHIEKKTLNLCFNLISFLIFSIPILKA